MIIGVVVGFVMFVCVTPLACYCLVPIVLPRSSLARIIRAYRKQNKVHGEGGVQSAEDQFNNEVMRP